MRLDAAWRDDCQGKRDYDASVIDINVRSYPRGGGFHLINTSTGEIEGNDSRPDIKPAAYCSVYVNDADGKIADRELARVDFEAETQAEVERMAEDWAAAQYHRIVAAVKSIYSEPAEVAG